ncbi:MAG: MFS transporter [Candidatus Tectomicrobia bacterium]|nr:MFS transporter [Candidatus Tectomicrobia bacterium]
MPYPLLTRAREILRFETHRQLWWCSMIHLCNDGYSSTLSLLLPFIAADLGLSYTQVGFLKTVNYTFVSALQTPAGFLAEKVGAASLLGGGLGWYATSYTALWFAGSYLAALICAASAGIGGSAYHPVGTSLIAESYPLGKRGSAIGTLNFAGDVGKVIFPAIAGFLVIRFGWRGSCALLGGMGFVVAVLYLKQSLGEGRITAKVRHEKTGAEIEKRSRFGIRHLRNFLAYVGIGFFDEAARTAVIVFISFLLLKKGVPEVWLGSLLALMFTGGALGKFACGYLTDRIGGIGTIILTEILMILGCLLLPSLHVGWLLLLPFLLGFGFVLNGTSSVMYIGLADTLTAQRQSVGYGIYYTINFASSAVAPLGFGLLADRYGVPTVFYGVAGMTLAIFPLLFCLKKE